MAEVQFKFGWPGSQITYTAVEPLVGGQMVERRTGVRLVGVAGNGSTKVCGCVRSDVPASRASIQGPQVGDGGEALVGRDCWAPCIASGALTVGQKVTAAALGKVRAYVPGTDDASLIVGEATEAAVDGARVWVELY